MTVISNSGWAGGIKVEAWNYLFADITNNELTGGITGELETAGIMISSSGNIGYDGIGGVTPILIDSNSMNVTSNADVARGIEVEALDYLFADITNNDLTSGIFGFNGALGIGVGSTNTSIGFQPLPAADPLLLDSNDMIVVSSSGFAGGIFLSAATNIFSDITNSEMIVFGETDATGVTMYISGAGSIGYDAALVDPVLFDANELHITADTGTATGLMFNASDSLFTEVTNSDFDIAAADTAYGVEFSTGTGLMGSGATSTLVESSNWSIHGNAARYLMWLSAGVVGGGNVVGWSGNVYVCTGGDGSWDGNYDIGEVLPESVVDQDQPIWTNFGSGDTITP
jgi:hypothetical protein